MFANYYKTAVRSIARSKFHALINIVGLSTGITFTMLIAAYCWSESQVNHQFRNADRQYILTSDWKNPATTGGITTLGPLAKALKENYPGLVANYYRWDGITSAISYGDNHFREAIQMGDSTFLNMYGISLLYGDARTALNAPFSVVITDEKALKLFGQVDVVGKDVVIDNFTGGKQAFRVTGVMRTPTHNSLTWLIDASPDGVFVPTSNLAYFGRKMDWTDTYIVNYVELQKGVTPKDLEGPITHLLKLNTPPNVQGNLHVVPQPLTSYYLKANNGTAQKLIYTLSSVALFILLMAIINFVNLSVSRSTSRMKEIGIRKVLGGVKRQLRIQFLTESMILALSSTAVAVLLYQLLRPSFAAMLGRDIPALSNLPLAAWAIVLLFALIVGWLAGLYPAAFLSSLSSVDALKGREGTVRERVLLRKGLVGFQFATATVVFVGAIIITQQIALFFSDRLGYNKEYVVSAAVPRDWSRPGLHRIEAVRDVFARMPEVKDATVTYSIPNGVAYNGVGLYGQGGDSTNALVAEHLLTDEHYASTYQIAMAAGVFFDTPGRFIPDDSLNIVLNETAVKAMGWQRPQDALGQRCRVFGVADIFRISGVVRDFHFSNMGAAIRPQVFTHVSGLPLYRYIAFKVRPGNIGNTVDALQKQWAISMPDAPFDYVFMDETLHTIYASELRLRKAASTATGLAIVIVLLGVVGLVSNSVRRRTKEIAIRKVIGASVPEIMRLFVREYLPVLLLAGIVASPFAWWIMQRWLDNYATRITITPLPFVLAIGTLGLVMVVLIAGQTIRAALSNPVKSLRSE